MDIYPKMPHFITIEIISHLNFVIIDNLLNTSHHIMDAFANSTYIAAKDLCDFLVGIPGIAIRK